MSLSDIEGTQGSRSPLSFRAKGAAEADAPLARPALRTPARRALRAALGPQRPWVHSGRGGPGLAPRPGARHSASANGAPQAGISEYLPLLDSVNLIFLRSETRTTRTRTAGRAGRPPGQGTTIRVRHPSTPRRPWGGVAVRETDRRIYFEILKTCICNFTVFTTTGAASGTGKRGLGRLYRPPASSLRGAVSSRESNQERAPRRGRIRAPLRICTRRT